MNVPVFQLEWKGRALGSFTMADLRARLATGEISRLHRVHVEGVWRPLGDWMDQLEANHRQTHTQEQTQVARETDDERIRDAVLEGRSHHAERLAHHSQPSSPAPNGTPGTTIPPNSDNAEFPRVSGLAIASLVFGILCGGLFCCAVVLASEQMPRWLSLLGWFIGVSWVLSIVFGHIALSEIHRQESLRGRGPAFAGLIIAYANVALITVFIIFSTLDDDRFLLR